MLKQIGWLLAAITLAGWTGAASALPFEYRADQFSVGGYVEEFNSSNNTFASWLGGTVNYQDGYAVFTDPGVIIPIPGSNLNYEYSGIAYQNREQGNADFVAQSLWSSLFLPEYPSGFLGQYFYGAGEGLAINIRNVNEEVAAAFGGDVVGLGISFTRITGNGEVLEDQIVSIDPLDITGGLVFQTIFSAASNQMTAAFSLDGGQSFDSPFYSYTTSGTGTHVLYGNAVESTIAIPASIPLFAIALAGLAWTQRKKTEETS